MSKLIVKTKSFKVTFAKLRIFPSKETEEPESTESPVVRSLFIYPKEIGLEQSW